MKTCTKCRETKALTEFNRKADSKDGHAAACRECRKVEKRDAYRANRESVLEAQAKRREENRETIRARQKELYYLNHDRRKAVQNSYYASNRERISEQNRKRREENLEKFLEKERQTRERLAEKRAELQRRYYRDNKDRVREYHRKYRKEKWSTDEVYVLSKLCRRRVLFALQRGGYPKKCKTAEMLGCSWEELARHIESQFEPGMTWENRGSGGWHLDHIIPLASAQTEEELIALCHYTNLQPLWAEDNLRKGAKLL